MVALVPYLVNLTRRVALERCLLTPWIWPHLFLILIVVIILIGTRLRNLRERF